MNRTLLKSKIHRATVTEANVEYEGSVTIDRDLLGLFIRRMAVDFDIPLVTDIKVARRLAEALAQERARGLEIKAWEEYR